MNNNIFFEIKIKNYKSIKDLNYSIKHNIQFLIGKNEVGKSNILDAIYEINSKKLNEKYKNFHIKNEDCEIQYNWNLDKKNKLKKIIDINSNYLLIDNLILNSDEKNFLELKKIDLNFDKLNVFYENIKKIVNWFLQYEFKDDLDKIKYYDWYIKDFQYFLSDNYLDDFIKEKYNFLNLNDFDKWEKFIEEIKKDFNNLEKIINKLELLNTKKPKIYKYDKLEILENKYFFEDALNDKLFLSFWSLLGQKKDSIEIFIENKYDTDTFKDEKNRILNDLNYKIKSFSKDFWATNSIKFKVDICNDCFMIDAADKDSEIFRNFNYRSDGMKKYISLLLFFEKIKNENIDNKDLSIILLDEPGDFLHAEAIMDLKKYLIKFTDQNKNIKIIVSTHNPFFINLDNMLNVNLVLKDDYENGTILISSPFFKNKDEKKTGILPFLEILGIDIESFLNLSNGIHVFVEGLHDFFLFNTMKEYFINEKILDIKKLKEINFLFMGSATEKKDILINLSFSLNKKIPFFIFDYDKQGNDGLKRINKKYFDNKENKHVFFVNLYNQWPDKLIEDKVETQNLFIDDEFDEKKISENKNTFFYFNFFNFIKNKKEKINFNNKTKENFKKIFERIILNS